MRTTRTTSPPANTAAAGSRLHRIIDVSLIVLASVSAAVFLLAFGVIRHFEPRHALLLELTALGGFALSALLWLIVAVATPAPTTVVDVAKLGARHVHDRLAGRDPRAPARRLAPEDHRVMSSVVAQPSVAG